MIYVPDDIPSKLLTKRFFPTDVERLFVELNLKKILLLGTYHPLFHPPFHHHTIHLSWL